MSIYMGVDWSATEVVCAVRAGAVGKLFTRRSQRTPQSVRELMAWVRKTAGEGTVHAVIEDGAEGWVELLHVAGAVVHVANPAKAKAYAASRCSSHAKDDARDADNLRSMGASPEHCPAAWEPTEDTQRELVELSTLDETLTGESTAWQQRIRALLREHFPSLESVLHDLSYLWVRAFLRAVPTPWHAKALAEADLRQALVVAGARPKMRDAVMAAVAETETVMKEAAATALATKVRMYVEHLDLLLHQLADVEEKLDRATAKFAFRAQLEAVDGIGLKMAGRLLRFALGEAPAHRDEASILLGASPVFQGSATDSNGNPKGRVVMRKSVDPYARATVYLLGRLATRHLAWAGKMYEDGRRKGQSAATAFRRVARSLLRILSAMATNGTRYDEAMYIARLKAKGVAWAQGLAA